MRQAARFCGRKHRQSAWRFERQVERLRDADLPKRHGVADPPYPGLAWLYKDHPDFAGDHRVLLSGLQEYDGWALCTSSLALDLVVDLCRELDIPSARVDPRGYRIASWHRGPRSVRSSHPQQAWEAVVYRPARADVRDDWPADSLVHIARPRTSDPRRVIGAKPAAYASWVFGLLACRRGDSLDDLFPGSHGIARAWREATRSS